MRAALIFASVGALATAAALIWVGWDALRARPPNVILLTVESLRADALTPALAPAFFRALEDRDAVAFPRHRAVSAWTAPNIIALLTGVAPADQAVHSRGRSLPKAIETPLEWMAERGWRIGSVQAFARIETYANLGLEVTPGVGLEPWLARRIIDGAPFFVWYHYLDTHLPFDAWPEFAEEASAVPAEALRRLAPVRTDPAVPVGVVRFEPGDEQHVQAFYRAGIRQFDAWFAMFWDFFQRSGLHRGTILVVTADHGEELLERGRVGHASTTRDASLKEEIVRVPLAVWLPPGRDRAALRAAAEELVMTDHLDVMPTILGLLGDPVGYEGDGRDLARNPSERPWYGLTSRAGFAEPDPDDIREYLVSIRDGRWKATTRYRDGRRIDTALFDLARDPQERSDRAEAEGEQAAHLAGFMDRRFQRAMSADTRTAAADGDSAAPRPEWIWPDGSRRVGYDDLVSRFHLEWTGAPGGDYVVEYEAGQGLLELSGSFRVTGTRHDFGEVERSYWNSFVVPYRQVTLRVRPAGGELWSRRITVEFER